MFANVPVAVALRDHCHVRLVTGSEEDASGSVKAAVSVWPPFSVPVIVTVPSSSTFVTLMVTAMVASTRVSGMSILSLLSLTPTVTL